ncbi:MAG: AAA family ATPase [Anaerolineales bacterium]
MLPDIKYRIYTPDEWTERTQWGEILEKIEAAPRQVIILEGDRGVGKTYLLMHLFEYYQRDPKVSPFFIGLDKYEAPHFLNANNFWQSVERKFQPEDVKDLLEKIAKYLEVKDFQALDDENKSEYLAKQLAQAQREQRLLVLVDSIYECTDDIRQQVEQNILKPLLSSNQITIILSGRGRRPVWINPEFRNATIIPLQPEGKKFVSQQLEKMRSKHVSEAQKIFEWSDGCPLVVRLLGKSDAVNRDALGRAIDVLIRDSLPEKIEGLQYEEIRRGIEKLALFNDSAYRELEIAGYLYPDVSAPESRTKTKKLVNVLLESALLQWDEDQGGLVLNKTIAHTLQKWFEVEEGQQTFQEYSEVWEQTAKNLAAKYAIEPQKLLGKMTRLDRMSYNDIVTNVTH